MIVIQVNCTECNKVFTKTMYKGGTRKTYCSHRCSLIHWRRLHPKQYLTNRKRYEAIPANKEKRRAQTQEYDRSHPPSREYLLWKGARKRAKQKQLICTIQLIDIKIPTRCPLLNILITQNGDHAGSSPSLDRIDSTKGYTPDNIWVISNRANAAKSDLSLQELKQLVENLEHAIVDRKIHESR